MTTNNDVFTEEVKFIKGLGTYRVEQVPLTSKQRIQLYKEYISLRKKSSKFNSLDTDLLVEVAKDKIKELGG